MSHDPVAQHMALMLKVCDEIVDASVEKRPMRKLSEIASPTTLGEYVARPPLRITGTDVAGLATELVEALTLADALAARLEQVVGRARLRPTPSLLEPWKDMRDAITDARSHAEGFHASALEGDL